MSSIELAKYLGVGLFVLILYSIPTAVLYGFTRGLSRLSRSEALILAFAGTQAVAMGWTMFKTGVTDPFMWAGLLSLSALLIWYGMRPGSGPTIALLVYLGVGLLLSNLYPLVTQPWGSTIHKAAFGALILRLALAGLLVCDLRTKTAPVRPTVTERSSL